MSKLSRWLFAQSVARSKSLRVLLQAGTDLLLPAICPRCQAREIDPVQAPLCAACQAVLLQPLEWLCRRCGAFSHPFSRQDGKCAHCRHLNHPFRTAIALGSYDGELRRTIVRMKQPTEQSLTYAVGQLLAHRATPLLAEDPPDVLCAVPMHWLRRLMRQTSSAETLARSAAHRMGLPFRQRLLSCARQTRKQSLLPRDERRTNVAGAFRVERPERLVGLHVGVLDDLMTSGATLDEIARLLKRCGARQVSVLVVARAVRSDFMVHAGRPLKKPH